LKEEALDRTKWRNRFGRRVVPVVRQIAEWMNEPSRGRHQKCRPASCYNDSLYHRSACLARQHTITIQQTDVQSFHAIKNVVSQSFLKFPENKITSTFETSSTKTERLHKMSGNQLPTSAA
jgi:hypothetical protein